MRFSLLPIFSALVLFAGLGNAAPAQLAERNGLEDIVDSVETILSAVVELLEWFLKSVDQSPLPVHSSSFTSSIVQSTTQAITSHVTYAPQTSSTPVFQITSASSSAAEATTSQAAYAPQTSSTPFVQITSAPSSAAEATTSHVTYAPETSSTPFFQITSALSSASQETTSHATYAPQTSSMPFVQITSDVVPVPSSTAVVSPENTQTRGRSPSPTSNPVDVAPQPTVATATASPIISSSASLAAPVVTQPVQSTVVSVPSLSPSTPSSSAQSRCYTGSEFPVEQEWATFNSLFEANLQEMQGFNSDDEIEAIRKSILQAESNSSINA
ncbi:hypothetical protein KEM55_002473 [Ascosphaera atra]|nr:hypothetical protein KEM55_002473 [Ascosphaera atra]